MCFGSQQFKKTRGKRLHHHLIELLKDLPISKNTTILDMGCGRGDIALYLARKAKKVVGIDYSKDAIELARQTQKQFPTVIRKKTQFMRMNVKHLKFPDDYFDLVISIDVFEHLYKNECEQAMKELSRVMKKEGHLYVHTGPNSWLYNWVYPLYILPMNTLLTKLDQLMKGISYAPLPNDPRTEEEKGQHVNEPSYFYLRNLFRRHHLEGRLHIEIGFKKTGTGFRTHLYNALVTLYPLSQLFPLNLLFGWVFIGLLTNKKA